jgi:hypothetical protein
LTYPEDTLLWVQSESCFAHVGECLCEVRQVVLLAFTRHDDVIHISEDIATYLVVKDLLGAARKS